MNRPARLQMLAVYVGVFMLTTTHVFADGPLQRGAADLEGTWIGLRQETEGHVRPLKEGAMRLTFVGNKLKAVGFLGPGEVELAVTVDAVSSPGRLSYSLPSKRSVDAVYEIRGDTLTIGIARPGHGGPLTLSSDLGSGMLLTILRRANTPLNSRPGPRQMGEPG